MKGDVRGFFLFLLIHSLHASPQPTVQILHSSHREMEAESLECIGSGDLDDFCSCEISLCSLFHVEYFVDFLDVFTWILLC